MHPEQRRNKMHQGAETREQRVSDPAEERSSNSPSTNEDNPGEHVGEVPRVDDAPVEPMRVLSRGMQMGVDLGNDISGNPGAVPNANAGGPSSTENIVGTNPEPTIDQGGEEKEQAND
jgi:hypothetical protein